MARRWLKTGSQEAAIEEGRDAFAARAGLVIQQSDIEAGAIGAEVNQCALLETARFGKQILRGGDGDTGAPAGRGEGAGETLIGVQLEKRHAAAVLDIREDGGDEIAWSDRAGSHLLKEVERELAGSSDERLVAIEQGAAERGDSAIWISEARPPLGTFGGGRDVEGEEALALAGEHGWLVYKLKVFRAVVEPVQDEALDTYPARRGACVRAGRGRG